MCFSSVVLCGYVFGLVHRLTVSANKELNVLGQTGKKRRGRKIHNETLR
jgi:hypothetical protein